MKKYIYVAIALLAFFLTFKIAGVGAEIASEPTPANIEINTENSCSQPGFQPDFLPGLSSEDDRVIIGNDDREPLEKLPYPYSTVGRIDFLADGKVKACTGTLIGRDLVLTNSHCLIPNNHNRIVFHLGMIHGVAEATANVVTYQHGWEGDPEEADAEDWALLKLDRPLGDDYGYLGWSHFDFSKPEILNKFENKLRIVSYAADFPREQDREQHGQPMETPGLEKECSIIQGHKKGPFEGLLFHDCDIIKGSSGGAMFAELPDGSRKYCVLGLNTGWNVLPITVQLPSGDVTGDISRAVQVNRWADYARRMR